MKTKLTNLFTTLALAAGFASAAWAAAPVAVWDGDFSVMTNGSCTLTQEGGTIADGVFTVGSDGGLSVAKTSGDFGYQTTVIIDAEVLELSSDGALITLNAGDSAQTSLSSNGTTLRQRWCMNSTDYGTLNNWAPTTRHRIALAYYGNKTASNRGTTTCIDGVQKMNTLGLMTANSTVSSIYLGQYSSGYIAQDMKIYRVAIFEAKLTADEIAAYQFPSEKKPLVVWSEDLAAGSVKNGFTMTIDTQHTAISSGSAVLTKTTAKAGKGIQINWDSSTFSGQAMTVLVKYSGLDLSGNGNTAMIGTTWGSTTEEVLFNATASTAVRLSSGVTSGSSGSAYSIVSGKGNATAGMFMLVCSSAGTRVVNLTQDDDGAWAINNSIDGSRTDAAFAKSASFNGIKIGGSIAKIGAYHRPGITVEGVAVYGSEISPAELANYDFDVENVKQHKRVAWNTDLADGSRKGKFTMNVAGSDYATAADGIVTVTKKNSGTGTDAFGVKITWPDPADDAASFDSKDMTVLVKYSDAAFYSANTAFFSALWGNTDKEYVYSSNGSKVRGTKYVWDGGYDAQGTEATYTPPATGLMLVTMKADGSTEVAFSKFADNAYADFSKAANYSNVRDANQAFYGIKVAGTLASFNHYYRAGMKVSAVAILDGAFTASTFPKAAIDDVLAASDEYTGHEAVSYAKAIDAEATAFSAITWTPTMTGLPFCNDVLNFTNNDVDDATVTFDKSVEAAKLTLTSAAGKDTTFAAASGKTVSIAAYDFSAASGKATVGFGTGTSPVTAGADTVLSETGTGTLTIGSGMLATVPGWLGANLSGAGTVAYNAASASTAVSPGAFASGFTGNIKLTQGTWTVTGNFPQYRPITVDGTNAKLTFNGGDVTGYGTGYPTLCITNGGTLYFQKRDTFSREIYLTDATVELANARAWDLYKNSKISVYGGTSTICGTTHGTTTNSGEVWVRRNSFVMWIAEGAVLDIYSAWNINSSECTGAAGDKQGPGTVVFNRAALHNHQFTVTAGKLKMVNAGSPTTGTIANNATVELNATQAQTVANVISGSGSLVKTGAGTTTLTGENTYTGGTTVEAGTLEVTAPNGSYAIGEDATLKSEQDISAGGTFAKPTIAANAGSVVLKVTMSKAEIQAETAVAIATLDASITTTEGFTATVINAETGNETESVLSLTDNTLYVTPQGAKQSHVFTPTASGDFTWQTGTEIGGKSYRDYDDITFATTAFTNTVNVASKVATETMTVGGKYTFTNSLISAETVQTTEGADATFENTVIADAVVVTNGTVMAKEIVASEVAVTNATFGSKVVGPSMKYVRLTITATQTSGQQPAVGEFRLYRGSATTGYSIVDWPKGTKVTEAYGSSATVNMTVTKESEGYPCAVGTSNESQPGTLIDGYYGDSSTATPYGKPSGYSTCAYNKWWMTGKSGPWIVTIEFPDPVATFSGCNFCLADHGPRNPTDWTIEVSSDGENWTTVNTTTGASWSEQYLWGGNDENTPAFLNDGTTPTDVKVGTGSTIVADGTWTAALEVGGAVTFKGVAGKYLTLDAASSSTFDAGAALTFDLTDYGVSTAGKQYVIAGPTEGWPETTAITVTPKGKFDLYKDDEGYYVLVRSGNYWIGDQADGVGTWDLSETMAWGADAETTDKSVWLNGVAAFFTRNGTVTIDAEADIQPTAINVTSNDGITVTFKGAVGKIANVPFNIVSTNVTVTIENDEEVTFSPTATVTEGTAPKFVKTGAGTLTLGTAGFTNIVVEAGTLKIGSGISLSGKQIEVKDGATLDPNGQSLAGATIAMTKSGTLTLTDVPTLSGTKIVITDAASLVPGKNYKLIEWTNWPTPDLLGYGMPTLELKGFAGTESNVRLVPGIYDVTLQYRSDAQVAHKPLVILPIGDSITEGLNNAGGSGKNYRIPLYNKLSLAGYNVKSVGFWTQNGGSANGSYDPSGTIVTDADWIFHCGKGSMRAGAKSGNGMVFDALLNDIDIAGNPDIVLLHIGINDMLNNGSYNDTNGTNTYAYLTNMITRAVNAHPDVTFVVSSPMCCEYGHSNQKAEYEGDGKVDCNKTFVTPVHTLMTNFFAKARAGEIGGLSAAAAKKIYFADLYQNVMPRWYGNQPDTFINDGSDKCHPNWLGHELMAQTWFDQITNAFQNAANPNGHYDDDPAEIPETELSATNNVPAAYRDGYVLARVFRPDPTERLNAVITGKQAIPYDYVNPAIDDDQCVGKVAYFFEYVLPTATTNLHRWVWADMDAFDTTVQNIGVPTNNHQTVVNNFHVCGNHPAVWNIDANDNTQKGFVEFTPYGISSESAGVTGGPAKWCNYSWNDKFGTALNYGCMQVHRMIDGGDMGREAQVVFAYNAFTSATTYPGYDFGIGNFSQSFVPQSMDWTFMQRTKTLSSTNLTYRSIEIWVKVAPTGALTAEVTDEKNWSDIIWTDAKGIEWKGLTGAYSYVITGTGTTTLDAALTNGATVAVNGGTLKLADADNIGTTAFTVADGATLLVTASGLKASQVTNNGTIRFEGGDATNPIAITGDANFGTVTLGADTYVKNTVDGNHVHNVTGAGASSFYALGKASGGVGFTTAAFTNLTLVSDCAAGERVWMERMTNEDIRLVANTTIYLAEVSPTVLSLSGSGTITRNGDKTLTIVPEAACTYSGATDVPFVIGGTELVTLSGAYTGALTVNAGASVKLTGSAVPSGITGAGSVTFDYGSGTTNTVALSGASAVSIDSGLVILKGYRDFVTLGGGAKAGFIVNINDCGSFTPPTGMTTDQIELYKVSGSGTVKVDATVEDGKFVFEWGYKGANAWLEYEFTTNLFNTGSADTTALQFDGTHCFDGDEYAKTVVTQEVEGVETVITNWSIKAASAPWRDVTFPSEVTVVMYGKMMQTSKACQIGIGSTTGDTKYSLFLAAGDVSKEEVVLGYAYYKDTSEKAGVREFGTLCKMSVPNAQTTDHLYAFTMKQEGDDTVVNIYLDGEVLQPYTFTNATVTLGSGIQLGSIHGGIGNDQDWPEAFGFKRSTEVETGATLDFLRVYDVVLNDTVMKAIAEDYPYISPNGSYSRTLSGVSQQSWEAVGAWKNESTKATTNTPAAGSSLELTAEISSVLKVNLNKDVTYESLRVCQNSGSKFILITTNDVDQLGKAYVTGRLTVGAATYVNPKALDLSGTPITVEAGQTLGFDLSGYDMSKFYADTFVDLTGVVTTNAGSVIGIVYLPQNPTAAGRTWGFVKNAQTQHYGLQVYVEGDVTGTVTGSGNWSEAITWKMGDSVIDEPDWTVLHDASVTIPAGDYAVTFDKDFALTNLTLTGSGTCTFAKGDGVAVSARTLDVSGAAGFTLGSADPIAVTETLTLGTTLNVAIDGAKHGSAIWNAPAGTEVDGVAVTVNGEASYALVNKAGALTLYKPTPTVFTVTQITSSPSTNFNSSAVVVTYSKYAKGDYGDAEVKLTVGGHEFVYEGELEEDGGTISFWVPEDVATAGNIEDAVVTVTGKGTAVKGEGDDYTAYDNTKYLYQGARAATTTNAWFDVTADRVATDGTWTPQNPPTEDGRIIFEDGEELSADYAFAPAEEQAGEVAIVETELSFDAALDELGELDAGSQAALRLVTDAEDAGKLRFAVLVNGAWVTNTTLVAATDTIYTNRVTLSYREIPATVRYELKQGDAYVEIANGDSRADKRALAGVEFSGEGQLVRMQGFGCEDTVDASLVANADDPTQKFLTIDAATQAGVTNLKLLWNTAWTPTAKGEWTIGANGYSLYWNAADGLLVKLENGVYTVITDYWEAMNLLVGADSVTTNRFMFLTNAIASAEAGVTNLYLLRDVTLPDEAVAVAKTMQLTGETNILAGAGFAVTAGNYLTVKSGLVGIPYAANVKLEGGRFNDASKASWEDKLQTGYTISALAVPVRGYGWQLMPAAIAPEEGEEVLPVKDAEGNAVSVVVNSEWAAEVTETDDPAEQAAALSVKQNNGLTRLDNEILGLENKAGEIPVVQPVQTKGSDKVTFSLGNVDQSKITASGARVSYRVFSSKTLGGKDGASSAVAGPAEQTQMDLPTEGVLYYTIEVDTGAVK